MDFWSIMLGFALGVLGSYLGLRLERSWQQKDDRDYTQQVLVSLIAEVEEGLDRAKMMARLADEGSASLGRVYTALWESSMQRLAATLRDTKTLRLLHQIYYRFELINFNCDHGRPDAGGAFARDYAAEIATNLTTLQELVREG